jgi:HEAT repeat protein
MDLKVNFSASEEYDRDSLADDSMDREKSLAERHCDRLSDQYASDTEKRESVRELAKLMSSGRDPDAKKEARRCLLSVTTPPFVHPPELRRDVFKNLSEIYGIESIAHLGASSSYKRRKAAIVLGERGDSNAVDPLKALLDKDEYALTRQSAVEAVVKIGGHYTSKVLSFCLENYEETDATSIIVFLSSLDSREVEIAFIDFFQRVLSQRRMNIGEFIDAEERAIIAATESLGRFKSPQIVYTLTEFIKSPVFSYRDRLSLAAIRALGECLDCVVLKKIGSEDRFVRSAGMSELLERDGVALGALEPLTLCYILRSALYDSSPEVAFLATKNLIKVESLPLDIIWAILDDESDSKYVKPLALRILGENVLRLKDSRLFSACQNALRTDDPKLQIAAILTLENIGGEPTERKLLEIITAGLINTETEYASDIRRVALEVLGRLWNLPQLSALGSLNEFERAEAIAELASLRCEKAVVPLIALLRDSQNEPPLVRNGIARSLVEIGRPVTKPLTSLLDNNRLNLSQDLQLQIIGILKAIGDQSAEESILRVFNYSQNKIDQNNLDLLKSLVTSLGSIGGEEAFNDLDDFLREPIQGSDPALQTLRLAAIRTLGRLWNMPEVIGLGDEQEKIRAAAVLQFHPDRIVEKKELTNLLIRMLSDSYWEVKCNVIEICSDAGIHRLFRKLREIALNDQENLKVRRAAVRGLGKLRDDASLTKAGSEDSTERVQAITRFLEESHLATLELRVIALVVALQDDELSIQVKALRGLGELSEAFTKLDSGLQGKCIRLIDDFSKGNVAELVSAAVEAYVQFDKAGLYNLNRSPNPEYWRENLLFDSSYDVRLSVIGALETLSHDEKHHSLGSNDESVRFSALSELGDYHFGYLQDVKMPILVAMLEDPSPRVREAVELTIYELYEQDRSIGDAVTSHIERRILSPSERRRLLEIITTLNYREAVPRLVELKDDLPGQIESSKEVEKFMTHIDDAVDLLQSSDIEIDDDTRKGKPTSQFFEHGYALLIGVGADLPVTTRDAWGLREILTDPGRCAYLPDNVELLTEKKATRQGILNGLEWLLNMTEKDSQATAIIYFSGHGGFMPDYHLVPFGYDDEDFEKTAISGAEFTGLLKAIKAQKLLVLLDCCHAGGIATLKGFRKSSVPPKIKNVLTAGNGRVLIASSRHDEFSRTGKPYSVFTQALRESLAGYGAAQRDGYAKVADIAMYVGRVVPPRTLGEQHPILDLSAADNFAVAYYAGGEKSPKPLGNSQVHLRSIQALDDDLLVKHQEVLRKLQIRLLEVEAKMAEFYDAAAIPPDLMRMKQELLERIGEKEDEIHGYTQ